jgi:ribonuclease-3
MAPAGKVDVASAAQRLEAHLGHKFKNLDSLQTALTHASARAQDAEDYQRLEFLGDRVLGVVVAEMLFEMFPGANEGELSLRLNSLVNASTCAEIGAEIGLDNFIQTGSDIKSIKGRKGANLRADVMEALIAAVYLEGGLDSVRPIIGKYWKPRAIDAAAARRDPKTELQEWAHRRGAGSPLYNIESREGPDHEPIFTVSVTIAGFEPGQGEGRSKRAAEQSAAEAVLVREGVWEKMGEAG